MTAEKKTEATFIHTEPKTMTKNQSNAVTLKPLGSKLQLPKPKEDLGSDFPTFRQESETPMVKLKHPQFELKRELKSQQDILTPKAPNISLIKKPVQFGKMSPKLEAKFQEGFVLNQQA